MKIYTLGHPVLYKKSAVIPDIDKKIVDLAEAMITTMREGRGLGLAAPQIGENLRMFVCEAPNDIPRVFINPEIIGTAQEQIPYEEGCLSVPGIYADIIRPIGVSIQAWDTHGKPFTLDADDVLGRVIQHELDHLNGVLFLDRLEEKKKKRLIKMYNKKVPA